MSVCKARYPLYLAIAAGVVAMSVACALNPQPIPPGPDDPEPGPKAEESGDPRASSGENASSSGGSSSSSSSSGAISDHDAGDSGSRDGGRCDAALNCDGG